MSGWPPISAPTCRSRRAPAARRAPTSAAPARRAEEETQDALRAYGYYHASVSTHVGQRGDCARVVIEVKQGPRVVVEAVELEVLGAARDDQGFMAPLATLPLVVGANLNHDKYTATKRLLETLALERG